jgi:hypothetical protein
MTDLSHAPCARGTGNRLLGADCPVVVKDGDALCLWHEIRAAALRHPADEVDDALLY